MRKRALFEIHQRQLAAAFLAVYASSTETGFRQRDLRFYFELFLAWSETFLYPGAPALANTQFKRVISLFLEAGYAKRTGRLDPPRYTLTKGGILEVVRLLVVDLTPSRINEALFVCYFVKNYGPRIRKLLESTERPSSALLLELSALLDFGEIKRELLVRLDKQIEVLSAYSDRCEQASSRTKSMLKSGSSLQEVVSYLQCNNPYQLNNQKPLKELYAQLVPDHATWELTEGLSARAKELWSPYMIVLSSYRERISALSTK